MNSLIFNETPESIIDLMLTILSQNSCDNRSHTSLPDSYQYVLHMIDTINKLPPPMATGTLEKCSCGNIHTEYKYFISI